MNKTELVAAMAKDTNLSKKDVEAVLKSFIDVVTDELKKGEKIQLVGFGTFEVSTRAATNSVLFMVFPPIIDVLLFLTLLYIYTAFGL